MKTRVSRMKAREGRMATGRTRGPRQTPNDATRTTRPTPMTRNRHPGPAGMASPWAPPPPPTVPACANGSQPRACPEQGLVAHERAPERHGPPRAPFGLGRPVRAPSCAGRDAARADASHHAGSSAGAEARPWAVSQGRARMPSATKNPEPVSGVGMRTALLPIAISVLSNRGTTRESRCFPMRYSTFS